MSQLLACLTPTSETSFADSSSIPRALDPIFAIGIGLAAAGVRIRREERGKGHTMDETIEAGKRRLKLIFSRDSDPRKSIKESS